MLKIKLKPNGKIHQRSFRIVVAEDRSKSDGKFIADLGFYTPQTKTLSLNKEKMTTWIKNGAHLTTGVDKLLNPDKYPNKIKLSQAKSASGGKKPMVKSEPKVEKTTSETKT
ncbi:30S ribosomal protein S16 [Candidatus Shapirobacteria bacterium CG06_land_8_20_14_3_00_40_12]|uniref:Small ribosomal subunit protein bS16 n=2 Tax=Candidatus Shapironibacteriota TaxID=1752721 RepID=A0A2M7TUA7_9BACT|nr:MAG: 30S ribosomal protein S16 [Candidatus Shapirobacteria bacterium CG06_land_8_20_14_3_00_40_12]PIZ61406.1 MAG: 30S ribosomal protein S16 [Candidatus Shapirobacteria bacterium CG_4_10_14_0_2_um_filter_40_12]